VTREIDTDASRLRFRDPSEARALGASIARTFAQIGRETVTLMHVCGSHEQAIARFGLRAVLPRGVDVVMGPGCPVCVTDVPEVDEAVALARAGVRVATYGDILRVCGSAGSLADAQAEGARVDVVYGVAEAVEIATRCDDPVVFFATGFETTAVATAAALLAGTPPNLSVLSAHKYVPPAMEVVAGIPGSRVEGFLAAGHAATITGSAVFEGFVERHRLPVVVAGFEPLDLLAGLAKLLELVRDGRAEVANLYPRCVTREGNRVAQEKLWRVFHPCGGGWRGIAQIPDGNLRLRDEWKHKDARWRHPIEIASATAGAPEGLASRCRCGQIMAGLAKPTDCELFEAACTAETPVGACMVSSEGTCRIWAQYGGHPNLAVEGVL
jgi:hydrogenase expression/formation protein HypD